MGSQVLALITLATEKLVGPDRVVDRGGEIFAGEQA